jgi:hypothetical protein
VRVARFSLAFAVAALTVVVAAPRAALAQQAQLQAVQGPYYAGVPIEMHVVAEGFEEEPTPDIDVPTPDGATLQFLQARPQVSSMVQIVNGRMMQEKTVRFAFVYQLTAATPGRYAVGPFTVTQGGKSVTTREASFKVEAVPQAGGQKLRLVLPEGRIFIGQRVPVTVEWWTEAGLADKLYDQRLVVPLFNDANFQFLDEEKDPSRVSINVETPAGTVEFPADVRKEAEGGKQWVVRSITRTMVPVAAGRFDLGEPTLFCEEATTFQRDIFGSRVPSRTRRVKVTAPASTLEVASVPAEGRPASFAGAIGQGFTISVTADRTVLQAGDPVKLAITIQGDGSLDAASLPPLDRAGLSPKQFRLPDGETAGLSDERGKHFDVSVRVIDPAVREIPPIEYSWFDPSTGRFASTRSQPIALSVRASTVVGAGDVVSAAPPEAPKDEPKQEGGKPAATRAPAFTLTGADLSIETDIARLEASSSSLLGSPLVAWTGYASGLLALGAGLFLRRRRDIDPAKARLQKDLRSLRARVAKDTSSKDVADALRRMAALRGDRRTRVEGLDGVLARLDEMAYAPGGASAAVPPDLRSGAAAVADAIVEEAQ